MKLVSRKPLAFTGQPNPREREQRQSQFLRCIAQGESILDACTLVGVTRSCYEHWRGRFEDFPKHVEAARESHRRDAACGLHTASAYARMLMDAIQRDDALPAALRYRAAKSLLSRKDKDDWLPEPLPASDAPLEPFDDELPIPQSFGPRPLGPHSPQPDAVSASNVTASNVTVFHATAPNTADPAGPQANGPASKPVIVSAAAPDGVTPAAIHGTVRGGNEDPDNPDKPAHPPAADNTLLDQQDTFVQAAPARAVGFFVDPDKLIGAGPAASPQAGAGNNQTAAASPAAYPAGSPSSLAPAARLCQTWLHPAFLHKHESPKAFERLLENHLNAYQPATPMEERLVFRLAQKACRIHRVETWERVIADSAVAKVRQQYPNAAAPAAIALGLHEAGETPSTRFHERAAKQRQEHESAQDRLESKLLALQQRREAAKPRDEEPRPSIAILPPHGGSGGGRDRYEDGGAGGFHAGGPGHGAGAGRAQSAPPAV